MFKLAQTYNDKIKLIVRDFPIDSLHPDASQAAKLAFCAHKMGVFWPAYNWLFANQDQLPEIIDAEYAKTFAGALSLSADDFVACFSSTAATTAINRDFAAAYQLNSRGTPTYFINGLKTDGAIEYSVWEDFIKKFYGIK